MNNIFNSLSRLTWMVVATLIFSAQSCGDYFDVGNNPNLVTEPSLNSLLASVTHRTGINAYRFGSAVSSYVQYTASPTQATATDTYDITDLSTTWTQAYYGMADATDMVTGAEAIGADLHTGVGKLIIALNLSWVADTWGTAPFTEAFYKVQTLTPSYDSEESLQQMIGQLIDEAISALQSTDATVALDPGSDVIHQGKVESWIRTAYGLKARYLNKFTKKSAYNPQAVLDVIDDYLALTAGSPEMTMGVFTGINPWAQISVDNIGTLLGGWLATNLVNHLNGNTYGVIDPRVSKITELTVNGNYVGTPTGGGNQGNLANTVHDECYISSKSPITLPTSPVYIMTYEELKFVEAEAALRAGNRARAYAAYIAGITASMEKLQVGDADANGFLERPTLSVGADNLTLSHIFKEKYVVTYLNYEAWNDARRHDYAYSGFEMPVGAVLPTFIRRIAIPNVELTTNSTNAPNQASLDTRLWWDQP